MIFGVCVIITYCDCDCDINDVDNHNDDGNNLIIFPGVPRRASEHEDLDLAGQNTSILLSIIIINSTLIIILFVIWRLMIEKFIFYFLKQPQVTTERATPGLDKMEKQLQV